MEKRWRILIAEDHTLLRTGLRALLAKDEDFEVIGEADNGRDAYRIAGQLKPDLVLMDISMPGMNGIEAIREIHRRLPATRVIVLTIHKTDEYIQEALGAGACGYVLKDSTHDELRLAIRTVLDGKTFLSPDVSSRVIATYLDALKSPRAARLIDVLTHRERQVLKLVAEGHHNKDIAAFLSLSPKTVEKHRGNLMEKLDRHNVASLTAFAIENGLLGDGSDA